MANPFVHVELNTNDVAKAKGFYSKMFDWKMEDMKMDWGTYTIISVGEGTGGGLMKHPIPGAPSFWLSYVLVDDVDAATKKVKELGGTVMKDKTVSVKLEAGDYPIKVEYFNAGGPGGMVMAWKPPGAT